MMCYAGVHEQTHVELAFFRCFPLTVPHQFFFFFFFLKQGFVHRGGDRDFPSQGPITSPSLLNNFFENSHDYIDWGLHMEWNGRSFKHIQTYAKYKLVKETWQNHNEMRKSVRDTNCTSTPSLVPELSTQKRKESLVSNVRACIRYHIVHSFHNRQIPIYTCEECNILTPGSPSVVDSPGTRLGVLMQLVSLTLSLFSFGFCQVTLTSSYLAYVCLYLKGTAISLQHSHDTLQYLHYTPNSSHTHSIVFPLPNPISYPDSR